MGKNCQICGKPSGMYPLCRTHLAMKANFEVEKCEICGTWYETKNACPNCKKMEKGETQNTSIENQENNVVVINEKNKHKCITCGKPVDGVLFCVSCYHKYKDKELYFKISNCSNVELLDENYEGRFTCKDGHIVKSKSERDIDNYLFEHGIPHAYERALPYGATEKEVLHPDFFLPNYLGEKKHVYIEHWGYNENNIQYTKTKKFKIPIYEEMGITLICTFEKTDTGDIDTVLDRKLNKKHIIENQINFNHVEKEQIPNDIILF